MYQHAPPHRMEVDGSGCRPITFDREPDGRRVVITGLLRFVEAPREPLFCPDTVRS